MKPWFPAALAISVLACGAPASPPVGTTSSAPRPAAAATPKHGPGFHHRFDDAESWAKVFDDPARDAWQMPDRVVGAMAIERGMTVADLGAGTGYFEPHLSRAVGPEGTVLAVDLEADMVRYLGERAKREDLSNVRPILASPADPRLPAGKIHRILIVDTWHHIDDRGAYAKRLAAALAPGGSVFVVDFTLQSPHGPPPRARLTAEAVAAELTEGGLVAKVLPVGLPDQYVVRGDVPGH